MKLLTWLFVAMMVAATAASQTPPPSPPMRVKAPPPPHPNPAIAGDYRADKATVVHVTHMESFIYRMQCDAWEGVGILEGATWLGVFRLARAASDTSRSIVGHLTVDFGQPELPRVTGKYTTTKPVEFHEVWSRASPGESKPRTSDAPPPIVVSDPDNPKFGEYVYVEELPEAITKVPPVYPDEARRAGVAGMVIVQALVLKNGTVGDTRVVKSDSGLLNDAAMAAVRQWSFKPAMAKGQPVAVWVAIPVKFSMN
jgi:TonB family protein